MSETNVGANLVFALRITIVCEPMPEANVSNSFSNIGLILVFVRRANIGLMLVFVRRANIRFAPTLVFLIGLILVFVRGEHKVRPTRRITKYLLLQQGRNNAPVIAILLKWGRYFFRHP